MHYEVHGQGNSAAGMVLLSSGLGGAAQYWSPQIPSLARTFRVIAYDHSGTGRSPGMLPDGYSVADMADEIASLLDKLDVRRCHFMGHAAWRPDRAATRPGPPGAAGPPGRRQ